MNKNFWKFTFRTIKKDLLYNVINILGLVIGITSALLIFMYVNHEYSYDKYHDNYKNIYRVASQIQEPDDAFEWINAQVPFGEYVKETYPEVIDYVQFFPKNDAVFVKGDEKFIEEDIYYADQGFFTVFSYELIEGDKTTALSKANTIIISKTFSKKYFGKQSPLGKTLETKSGESFMVSGLFEDVPDNSQFRFSALISRKSLQNVPASWYNFGVTTYLLLIDETNPVELEEKLAKLYDIHMAGVFQKMGITIRYSLQPIANIHLHSTNPSETEPIGNIKQLKIFLGVAILLLLIACINYINLATARSSRRAKEIGLKKTFGSNKLQLISQFLKESLFLVMISIVLSIILIIIVLPFFNHLSGKDFTLGILINPSVLIIMLAIGLIVGLLGGVYPAFYLAGMNPVNAFKGKPAFKKSGNLLRKPLVIIQFVISVTLIICTWIAFSQVVYMKNIDVGYEKENVVCLVLESPEMQKKCEVLERAISQNSNIRIVSTSNTMIGDMPLKNLYFVETLQGMDERGVNWVFCDHDYIDLMEMKLIEGKNFSENMQLENSTGIIINEKMAKRMNWSDPLEKKVQMGTGETGTMAHVIGVVNDFYQIGPYNDIESIMFRYRTNNPYMYIKFSGSKKNILSFLKSEWTKIFKDSPFNYSFLDDSFYEQFEQEEKRGEILTLFSIMTIIVSCLGVFGLVSFYEEKRRNEIGVRKVLGAKEIHIVKLISKEIVLLFAISLVVAFPTSYLLISNWLETYVNRVPFSVFPFIGSSLIVFIVVYLTISYHVIKAIRMNIVDTLKIV